MTWPARMLGVIATAVAIALGACDPDAYDPSAARARAADARAAELARHLETVPGVARASVVVEAPVADPLAPAGREVGAPRASVILALAPGADAAAAEDAARRAVTATTQVAPDHLTIAAVGAAAEPVVAVGPFRVASSSRRPLIATLAAALIAIAALAGWIALTGARRYIRRGARPQ